MDEYLPVALLHLREAEIVRLCGLTRAARGQEYARTGQVRQAERAAGTLRAAMQAGEAARTVLARFSDSGLDAWACSCSPAQPEQASSPLVAHPPCEHVAALLYLWVREPERFRVTALPAGSSPAPGAGLAATGAQPSEPFAAAAPVEASPRTQKRVSKPLFPAAPAPSGPSAPAAASAAAPADLEQLDAGLRRFFELLALAGGSVTESEAQRLFARLGLGEPEAALPALERLHQHGFIQPVFAAAPSSRYASLADHPSGWAIPAALLEQTPRVLPLSPLRASPRVAEQTEREEVQTPAEGAALEQAPEALPPEAGLREERAAEGLPALLFLVAAQMVDRSAPAPQAAASQKPASRSAFDLDAALAQQWAPRLHTPPEQLRFCLGLLRLLGLLPQPPERAGAPPSAAALPGPIVSYAQARETLLRAYRVLSGRSEEEVLRDLFIHWLRARSTRELVELRDAGVRVAWLSQRESRSSPDIAAENQAARQFVVKLLRWAPVGRWWSFGSLVEFVWRFQPAFLRGRQQTFLRPLWWLERLPEGQPLAMDVRADWRQGEGRYLALLLRRDLHWLGVVDLALDEQGRLKGFRVTPTGAWLLGAVAAVEGMPEAHASATRHAPAATVSAAASQAQAAGDAAPVSAAPHVQKDGILLVPLADLQAGMLDTLLWWCEPLGATREALRFRPGAERVAAALDAGQDIAAWLAWLEQHPRKSAALTALLAQARRWAALYGQVRLHESAALLEVDDPALLRELEMTLTLLAQSIDHTLAPGLAVLRPDAAGALVEEMQRRGYSPWIIDDESPE